MAKYDIVYSCGHEGRVDIIGPTKDRQRKADWYASGLCPECYEAKKQADRATELEKAKQNAVEMELPELTGSDKQVAWAMKIRDVFVANISNCKEPGKDFGKRLLNVIIEGNLAQTTAKWWIDWRDNENIMNPVRRLGLIGDDIARLLNINIYKEENVDKFIAAVNAMTDAELYGAVLGEKPTTVDEKQYKADTEAARTVRPETPASSTVVAIETTIPTEFTVKTPEYIEVLVPQLKRLGCKWASGAWHCEFKDADMTANRIVEVAVNVVSKGYTVILPNDTLAERTKNADYKPYNSKTIKHLDGTLRIRWTRKDGDFYDAAKRLPGAKYSRDTGAVHVPCSSFAEVRDFAQMYGFEVSPLAAERMTAAEETYKNSLVSNAKPKKAAKGDFKPGKLDSVEAMVDPTLADVE
ncbi:hypothetical protein FACS1894204_04160 [Synergistales bacterium]|nr:hypothetical protein FACS1894204_04160 [Synergistales bacterium]